MLEQWNASVDGRTMIASAATRPNTWPNVKRTVDIVGALILLTLVLPLLALAVAAVAADSRGPVLFRQTRHGLDGRTFTMLKFRTMVRDASSQVHRDFIAHLVSGDGSHPAGTLKKLTADARVTRVGRVLRATSIDELPQLVNVLRGEMSLVGPRPALSYELEHYRPEHFERFWVRPGLTGLWQVSGRSELGFVEMLTLDTEYARHHGPRLDFAILARTPIAMSRKRAA
jgi:lipopolysaccharide/colanic/teichoic acid biosynthesis glycosyltransferase